MTKEQWLVYLWGIYPNGGFSTILVLLLICIIIFLLFIGISYMADQAIGYIKEEDFMWNRLGKAKYYMVIIPTMLLLLAQLVPDKKTFFAILATPYIVDGAKTSISYIDDNNITNRIDNIVKLALQRVETSLQSNILLKDKE